MFLIITMRLITSLWKQQIQNRGRFARGSLFIHKETLIGFIFVSWVQLSMIYLYIIIIMSLISLNLSDLLYPLSIASLIIFFVITFYCFGFPSIVWQISLWDDKGRSWKVELKKTKMKPINVLYIWIVTL